jgi:hypothetical protein
MICFAASYAALPFTPLRRDAATLKPRFSALSADAAAITMSFRHAVR